MNSIKTERSKFIHLISLYWSFKIKNLNKKYNFLILKKFSFPVFLEKCANLELLSSCSPPNILNFESCLMSIDAMILPYVPLCKQIFPDTTIINHWCDVACSLLILSLNALDSMRLVLSVDLLLTINLPLHLYWLSTINDSHMNPY